MVGVLVLGAFEGGLTELRQEPVLGRDGERRRGRGLLRASWDGDGEGWAGTSCGGHGVVVVVVVGVGEGGSEGGDGGGGRYEEEGGGRNREGITTGDIRFFGFHWTIEDASPK